MVVWGAVTPAAESAAMSLCIRSHDASADAAA